MSPPLSPPRNFNHTLWMSFLTESSAQATIFIVSSNIGVQIRKRRAISLCESIISMAETNGRLEYRIWDSELKQADVMEMGYLLCWGYPGMCHFPGYTFCLKILEQNVNFEEKF